jgi:hypothetical protein
MTTHFDEPCCTIHWDEDGGIVWAECKDSATGEPLKRALEAALRVVVEKKAHRYLADTRLLGTMDPADVKWANENWLPRVVAAGISRMALLAPKKAVVALAVRSFMARINGRELANVYFDDLEAARAWLRAG